MNLLSCLKSFVVVVNTNSFSSAARQLYVSPAKLSKQISWLERELKIKLFVRSTRKLALTDEGALLYEKTAKLFEELDQIKSIATVGNKELQGNIRIYLSVTPAIPYLNSLSIQFMQTNPQVEISFLIGSEMIGLLDDQFDLAISFDEIKHPKLMSRKLFAVQRGVYAAPSYIKEHGAPKKADDLEDHNCLINTLYGLQSKWLLGKKVLQVHGNFRSNNAAILRQAAVEGVGIIWAPPFSVAEEVKKGQLQQLLVNEMSPEINLYAIYPKHLSDTHRVIQLINYFRHSALKDKVAVS